MTTINERYANTRLMELEEIYTAVRTSTITFSKSKAAKIIGSRYFLEKLITASKIRMTKATDRQFEQCKCNAEDVLRHANYKHKTQT